MVPSKHTPSASQIYPSQEGNYNYKFVIPSEAIISIYFPLIRGIEGV